MSTEKESLTTPHASPSSEQHPQDELNTLTYPEGGTQAWLIVAGSFVAMFCTFGYISTFGVYEVYYHDFLLQGQSHSQIAWIGSLQVFFMAGGALLFGPSMDRFGPRMIVWPGAALLVTSVMLTSVSKSLYQLILTQGLLGGLGISMIYTPSIAVLGHYFQKRRFLAIGLTSAGSPVGGVVFPILLYRLLFHSNIGFGWAVRIIGFIQLGLLLFACLTLVPRIAPRKNRFFLPAAFKRPAYSLQIAGLCLVFWGQYTPFFFLPAFAVRQGVPVSWSFYIIALMNCGSFLGRLISSHLAKYAGNFNILLFGIYSTGILLFCWIRMTSFGAIVTFSILYGYTTGIVFGLCPGTMAMLAPHPNEIGTYLGMGMSVLGVFALTGSPIMGAVLSASHGNFVPAAVISGALVMTGSVVVGAARYLYAPRTIRA